MQLQVSIIIPVFNQVDLTRACLETLIETIPASIKCEIVVVDNHSTDGTPEYLAEAKATLADLSVIRNEANLGFAKACNLGARASQGKYLLFLNNDTQPLPGWLQPLVKILDDDPRVGAVGNKLIYPDGTIQHAGVGIIDNTLQGDPLVGMNMFAGQPADHPPANRLIILQAVTAACALIRRRSFDRAGGFDEGYWNGYEDVDLCFRMRELDWEIVYQPASVVIHFEGQSGPERFLKVKSNIDRLHQKWLGKIKPDFIVDQNGRINFASSSIIREYRNPSS